MNGGSAEFTRYPELNVIEEHSFEEANSMGGPEAVVRPEIGITPVTQIDPE